MSNVVQSWDAADAAAASPMLDIGEPFFLPASPHNQYNASTVGATAILVHDGCVATVRDHTDTFNFPMETRDRNARGHWEERTLCASRACTEELHVRVPPEELRDPACFRLVSVPFTRRDRLQHNAVFVNAVGHRLSVLEGFGPEVFDERRQKYIRLGYPHEFTETTEMAWVSLTELLRLQAAATGVTTTTGERVPVRHTLLAVLHDDTVRALLRAHAEAAEVQRRLACADAAAAARAASAAATATAAATAAATDYRYSASGGAGGAGGAGWQARPPR